MKPSVVASLGTDARQFLSAMAPELAAWAPRPNPPPGVVQAQLGGVTTTAVALLHPSGYYGSLGDDATATSAGWMPRLPSFGRPLEWIRTPADGGRVHHGEQRRKKVPSAGATRHSVHPAPPDDGRVLLTDAAEGGHCF